MTATAAGPDVLAAGPDAREPDVLEVRWLGRSDYRATWDLQREVHAAVAAGEAPPTLLLCEHDHVYTAGRRTEPLDRPLTDPGAPVVDVDRGGRITWHGPGQLVAYPILRLPPLPGTDPAAALVDVVAHVRRLEEAVLDVCGALGLAAQRVTGRSGVWMPPDADRPERKVAAVGVRVARGTTLHGLAVTCDADLSWFDRIVPCGIADAGVTSLTAEAGRRVGVDEVRPLLEHALRERLGAALVPAPSLAP